jgi:anthranilate phosphoribosyltransferase
VTDTPAPMDTPLHLPTLIKEIGRGARGARDLPLEQARQLFAAMLDGQVDELRLGAIVVGLRVKGESVDELAGFHAALQARTLPLAVPPGPRPVLLPTLNGARKLVNLMPLLALQLARDGVPVLIHGRSDFGAARGDSFGLLAALDHPACTSREEAELRLEGQRLAVLPTALLCPGLDALMALRARIGLRNSAHTLAKLLDPFEGRGVKVAAVTHGDFYERLAELLPRLGSGVVMKGCEGEAYPHPRRASSLKAWRDGAPLSLAAGEPEEAELLETAGEAQDAARIQSLFAAGPGAWPARLRELHATLLMLSAHM